VVNPGRETGHASLPHYQIEIQRIRGPGGG
jgi:hypothetical protein